MLLAGKYKTQLFDPRTGGFMQTNQGIGMHVDVRDPEDKPILSAVSAGWARDGTGSVT